MKGFAYSGLDSEGTSWESKRRVRDLVTGRKGPDLVIGRKGPGLGTGRKGKGWDG